MVIGIKHGSEMAKRKIEIGGTGPTFSHSGKVFFVEQPQIWKLRRDFLIFTAV